MFQAIRAVSNSASPRMKTIIYAVYWGLSVLAVVSLLLFVYTGQEFLGRRVRTYLFATFIGLLLAVKDKYSSLKKSNLFFGQ